MDDHEITQLIAGLVDGDEQATEQLAAFYYEPIVRLVQRRLPASVRRVADGEDVANSALRTFLRRARQQNFPDVAGRDDLWKLLLTISLRKTSKLIARINAQKRGGGGVRGESILVGDDSTRDTGFDQVADPASDPTQRGEVQQCAEQILGFFHALDDDTLKAIALAKSEGRSDHSIAEELQCSTKTVQRKLRRLRSKADAWAAENL